MFTFLLAFLLIKILFPGIPSSGILKDYDIKRDQKIGFLDLVAGKGESRTPGIQEPTEDPNYDPKEKVSLLSSERDNFQKIDRLENNKIEPIEFTVAPAATRLVSSEREPEVLENRERDFDEKPSSPQSDLQIDEREESVISPELPS